MSRDAKTIELWYGRLPHWEVVDGQYFVTIHVRGAIPAVGQDELRARIQQMRNAPEIQNVEHQRRIFRALEHWLETTTYCPLLEHPDAAGAIMEAIQLRSDRGDWRMHEYVIMPNHVHLFFATDLRLKRLLSQFKRWTAGEVKRVHGTAERHIWQQEWFDHWSRSPEEDERIRRYIHANPVNANLVTSPHDWPYRGPT